MKFHDMRKRLDQFRKASSPEEKLGLIFEIIANDIYHIMRDNDRGVRVANWKLNLLLILMVALIGMLCSGIF